MPDKGKPGTNSEKPVRRTLADKKKGTAGRKRGVRHPKLQAFLMSRTWNVYGAGLCLFGLAVLVFCAGLVLDGLWTGRLDKLEIDLRTQAETAEADARRNQEQDASGADGAMRPNVGPVDYVGETNPARRAEDDRIAMDMIAHATTWSSRVEYEESRRELLRSYEWLTMNTNGEFLASFFPPGDELYVKIGDEVVSDPLSDGRNITFESMTTYLLAEDANGTRHYLAEAVTQSSGQVGGTNRARLAMTYDTRSDGSVWNMKCYSV